MLKRNWPYIYPSLVALTDFIVFNLAFLTAIYLRYFELSMIFSCWQKWVFLNIIFCPIAFFVGIYRGVFQISLENQDSHLKKFTFYLGLVTMSYLFLVKTKQDTRGVFLIFLVMQYFFLSINHFLLNTLNRILIRKGFGRKNTLIVGSDISVHHFNEHLHDIFGDYYNIKGYVSNGSLVIDSFLKENMIGKYDEIENLIRKYKINQVFIVSKSMLQKNYDRVRKICEKHGIHAKMVSPYVNNLMRQIKIKDVTGVPLTVNYSRSKFRKLNFYLKNILDKILTIIFAIFLLPLSLIIALLIKINSKGPVFFEQKRALYKNGPVITVYKFRTMYNNADEIKIQLLDKNESNGALFKMKDDPRITPIGRLLRKYSLDEIPQFINVLKGEMSIIGPRPLPLNDFNMIKNGHMNYDWYVKRGEAKPGITGLWQISGRSDLSFEEMCLLDLYYVENHSVFLDLEIMFETIPVMILGKGAY
jgi:exopolysaccharide biosynthesis polyprenyl glycosylphosphotransferase